MLRALEIQDLRFCWLGAPPACRTIRGTESLHGIHCRCKDVWNDALAALTMLSSCGPLLCRAAGHAKPVGEQPRTCGTAVGLCCCRQHRFMHLSNLRCACQWQGMLSPTMYSRAKAALLSALVLAGAAVATATIGYVMASPTFGWTGAAASNVVVQPPFAEPAGSHIRLEGHSHTIAACILLNFATQDVSCHRPFAESSGPHIRVQVHPYHRFGVGAPAAGLALVLHRPQPHGGVLRKPYASCRLPIEVSRIDAGAPAAGVVLPPTSTSW